MKFSYFRNENIGLYFFTNDNVTVAPSALPDKYVETISKRLGTTVLRTEINRSDFIGIYCAGNNNGFIVPYTAEEDELAALEGLDIFPIKSKANAFGNNIVANSKIAIIAPVYNYKERKAIEDALDVELIEFKVAEYLTPGSFIRMNDNAFLLSYKAEDSLGYLKETLGIDGKVGSVNRGSPIIKLGLVVNNKAYIAGSTCSGIEIRTMEEVFI